MTKITNSDTDLLVAVFDNDHLMVDSIKAFLEDYSINVFVADNQKQIKKILLEKQVDILITDLIVNEKNQTAFLTQIFKIKPGLEGSTIIHTSLNKESIENNIEILGVSSENIIQKPCKNQEVFLHTIEKITNLCQQ